MKDYLNYKGLETFWQELKKYLSDKFADKSTTYTKTEVDSMLDNAEAMVNTTWAELKALRDAGELIAGQQYRITDYVATTIDTESRSANHPFDIIVTADDERTLNESARAIAHDGDTYFEQCNLAAWKLKYSLDNDDERFAWVYGTK